MVQTQLTILLALLAGARATDFYTCSRLPRYWENIAAKYDVDPCRIGFNTSEGQWYIDAEPSCVAFGRWSTPCNTDYFCAGVRGAIIGYGVQQIAALAQMIAEDLHRHISCPGTVITCDAVSDVVACDNGECYTCGARIVYLVSIGYSQSGAESKVASEFPTECGACAASNGPTSSSNLPTSSSNLPTSTSNLPTDTSSLPTSTSSLPTKSIVITNQCPYTVWPGLNGRRYDTGDYFFGQADSAQPAGFELQPGGQRVIPIPDGIRSLTVWPRTGCVVDTDDDSVRCQTGECGNPHNNWDGTCFNSGPEGSASLAEATVLQNGGGAYYDISLVDGYTIPMGINAHHGVPQEGVSNEFNCKNPRCDPDMTFELCPPESRVSSNGVVVGCNNIHKAIYNNEALAAFPDLQAYRDDNETRSHIECSCLVGSCAGENTGELLKNLLNGPTLGTDRTGYCCSPDNSLYRNPPQVASHICFVEDKPLPLNNFGDGLRYDQIFKAMCPQAYSWQFDDVASTYQCDGSDLTLEVVFC